MSQVKKKHLTRRGLEPRPYRRSREYSDHLVIGPHASLCILQYVVLLPRAVVFLPFQLDTNADEGL